MKVSDHIKRIRSMNSVSNHRFFNLIVDGVQRKVEESIPGLKLAKAATGLTDTGGTTVLTGRMIVADEKEKEEVSTNVRQVMGGLKNPSDLLSTIE